MNSLIEKAQRLALEGNWGNEAIDVNKKILELNNKDVGSYNRLAKCFIQNDKYIKAKQMYEKVIEIDPDNTIAKNSLDRINDKFKKENKKADILCFNNINRGNNYKELEKAYLETESSFKLKDNKKIIEVGNRLINLVIDMTNSNTTDINNNVVNIIVSAHLECRDAISAIEWIDKLPSNKRIVNIKQKLYELKDNQKGFKIDDIRDVFLLTNLGKLHKELRALDKAKLILQKALNLDPYNTYTLNVLGSLSRKRYEYKEGVSYYVDSLKIRKNEVACTGLGAIYRDIGEFDLAKKAYYLALSMNEKSNYAHNGIGAVFVDIDNYDEAERHFLLANDNIEQLLNYADDYINRKKIEKAILCLECILKKDSKNMKARTKLQYLQNNNYLIK